MRKWNNTERESDISPGNLAFPKLNYRSGQAFINALAGIDQAAHRINGIVEHRLFIVVQLDLDNPLGTIGTDYRRHADIHVTDTELAIQLSRTGQNAFFVIQIGFGHLDGGRSRGVEGGTGFQQLHDFGATITGALHDLIQLVLADPADRPEPITTGSVIGGTGEADFTLSTPNDATITDIRLSYSASSDGSSDTVIVTFSATASSNYNRTETVPAGTWYFFAETLNTDGTPSIAFALGQATIV